MTEAKNHKVPKTRRLSALRESSSSAVKAWLPLLVLQALVSGIVLFPFITGDLYFAFLDIGSDTFVNSAGHMNFSRMFARKGFSGWSFAIGLGAPVPFGLNDIVGHLSGLAGPEYVLQARIWIYLLKIVAAGLFFFLLARAFTGCDATALIGALAYSFCGYIVTNGTWDSETNIFVFAPLTLLGMLRFLRQGDWVTFPLSLGAMLLNGVFFVLLGVSLAVAFVVCVAAAEDRSAMARKWITGLIPLAALGFVLGAPYVLPMAVQLLDSPRLSESGTTLERLMGQGLTVSSGSLLLAQIGALFHKDIFGIGNFHGSYMNYLESPGFYVGLLPLLLLPQLWRGRPADRRMLVVGVAAITAYFLLPAIRLSAFGFAAPYFRGTTLWVSIGVLLLGTRALSLVLARGVDGPMLVTGSGGVALLLGLVAWVTPAAPDHTLKVAMILLSWTLLLALAWRTVINMDWLRRLVVGLLLIELVVMGWPSLFVMREHATPTNNPHRDVTQEALEAVRADRPPPFYRVEKTFDSFGHSDALAQDYRGVKSYYYHGRAVVQFHQGVDLMHDFKPRPTNYTNWLPAPMDRYMLQSVLGVRYIISKTPLNWPGLEQVAAGAGWFTYRNELALPLGVVHTKQIVSAEFAKLSSRTASEARSIKDMVLVNAVVLDELQPRWGTSFDLDSVLAGSKLDIVTLYAQPARALQSTGLKVSHFSEDRILGTISPGAAGILVLSIPAYAGWSLRIDGQPVPLTTANFGMLAAPVEAGPHQVELTYRLPGLHAGLWACLVGLLALIGLAWLRRSQPAEHRVAIVSGAPR